ncbi:MAG: nucleotidyltransferase [Thiotrichales bacterium]|nr:nucleotidyltransferase [Thiotrichales bacterium]
MGMEQQAFLLENIAPFDRLPLTQRRKIAANFDVLYLTPAERFVPKAPALFLVVKGLIQESQNAEVVARYSEGSYFNEASLLKNTARLAGHYSVVEESILYRIDAAVFQQTLEAFPQFHAYFYASVVQKLEALYLSRQQLAAAEIMMEPVYSTPLLGLVTVEAEASVAKAAQQMVAHKTDACLVVLPLEHPARPQNSHAILTSTDILRFTAQRQSTPVSADTTPALTLANWPLYTVSDEEYLFNALLKMTRYQIDRLVVRSSQPSRSGDYLGFLHLKDLMAVFAHQSTLVWLNIEQAHSVDELVERSAQLDKLVATLHAKGIKVHYIAKLVSELHQKLLRRLVGLLLPEDLQNHVALLLLGSEGRAEQLLRTDQDNALIYADGLNAQQQQALIEFSDAFSQAMLRLGFPTCPGGVMLNQSQWRQSHQAWYRQLRVWLEQPTEAGFLHLAIFADAQVLFGDADLLQSLQSLIWQRLEENPLFLRHFAKGAMQFTTPVGFFGGLVTRASAKGAVIDLKKGAIFPIVHGVRVLALEHQIPHTNTHRRIKALMDIGIFSEEQGVELGESLNYLHALRLDAQLRGATQAEPLGESDLAVADLTHLQQDILKQALEVVKQFKQWLQLHFKLRDLL